MAKDAQTVSFVIFYEKRINCNPSIDKLYRRVYITLWENILGK